MLQLCVCVPRLAVTRCVARALSQTSHTRKTMMQGNLRACRLRNRFCASGCFSFRITLATGGRGLWLPSAVVACSWRTSTCLSGIWRTPPQTHCSSAGFVHSGVWPSVLQRGLLRTSRQSFSTSRREVLRPPRISKVHLDEIVPADVSSFWTGFCRMRSPWTSTRIRTPRSRS